MISMYFHISDCTVRPTVIKFGMINHTGKVYS